MGARSMPEIGIDTRVSAKDRDPQRQFNELRELAEDTVGEPEISLLGNDVASVDVRSAVDQRSITSHRPAPTDRTFPLAFALTIVSS